jgi:hypothetical protein
MGKIKEKIRKEKKRKEREKRKKRLYEEMVHFIISHPEVYILIIPGFGIISHVLSRFSMKPIFGQLGPKSLTLKYAICGEKSQYEITNVKIFHILFNPQITNAHHFFDKFLLFHSLRTANDIRKLSMLVGISEAICVLYFFYSFDFFYLLTPLIKPSKQDLQNPLKFHQWLAGLIDADGSFLLTKKGYASLEITMDIRDKKALFLIKQLYGGSVKLRSGSLSKRYRMHHKEGILRMIHDLNGHIRNPIRILQFSKLCEKYSIQLKYSQPLTYYNHWFAGFFDGDGSIYMSPDNIIISASNNMKPLLDELQLLYGGTINITHSSGRSFKWTLQNKQEILDLFNYFKICPCYSAKMFRILKIPSYFELRKLKAHSATPLSINGQLWARFINKWNQWQ